MALTSEQIIEAVIEGITAANSAIRDTVEGQNNSRVSQSPLSDERPPERA